ncbi:hypothetical protein MXB_1248 [Myxobolus squamalis]|nr:hypothetical protein MXB_1248 [Myxobolus squamalis]
MPVRVQVDTLISHASGKWVS